MSLLLRWHMFACEVCSSWEASSHHHTSYIFLLGIVKKTHIQVCTVDWTKSRSLGHALDVWAQNIVIPVSEWTQCWLTLCSETRVNSPSCLPHEIGPIKILSYFCVCVFVWTYLTGSNTSFLVRVINGRVCLHEINLVFDVFKSLRVSSLKRERKNGY